MKVHRIENGSLENPWNPSKVQKSLIASGDKTDEEDNHGQCSNFKCRKGL